MIEAVRQAGMMLWEQDPHLISCVKVSMICSAAATAIAALVGIPLALLLGRRKFPGRKLLLIVAHTGMAVPTVVIGLLCYAMLSRSGPLGAAGMLYTKKAIILGEICLALPIIVALVSSSVAGLDRQLEKTAQTLGGSPLRTSWMVLREARTGLIAATMAAFGRVVSELGIAMMVGGNIRGLTRTMTTAMALETQKGQIALGLALGLVLLVIALGINAAVHSIKLPSWR